MTEHDIESPRAGVGTPGRAALSRERVLRTAVAVADAGGAASLTMRSLAADLGVKPMSLYHYVRNKDDLLDGMVDLVFDEIAAPEPGGDWHAEVRRRAASARRVLRTHRWAIGLLDSRTSPGPATLRHHEAMVGTLRRAGFSVPQAAHAYALLDSYLYGFVVQESALPFDEPGGSAEVAEGIVAAMGDAYPYLAEMAAEHVLRPGYDFGEEFERGLDTILDALAALLPEARAEPEADTARRPRPGWRRGVLARAGRRDADEDG